MDANWEDWPEENRGDLADVLARLERGQLLSMPLSRPMPSIRTRVHELRFRGRDGIYRVIYFIKATGMIVLLHAFQKKTQQTPTHNIELAKDRLRRSQK